MRKKNQKLDQKKLEEKAESEKRELFFRSGAKTINIFINFESGTNTGGSGDPSNSGSGGSGDPSNSGSGGSPSNQGNKRPGGTSGRKKN